MAVILMCIVLLIMTAMPAFGWPAHQGIWVVLFALTLVAMILLVLAFSPVGMPTLNFGHR